MPTVPIAPQVELQGGGLGDIGGAVAVEPVRNSAGLQAEKLGGAMVNAGQVLGSIASKMQNEMDDAATKQADIAFLTKAQDILRGEKGYLNTLGAGAADVDGVNAALTQAQEEVAKTLGNDVQRFMFQQSASRNMLNFKSQISEHRFKQTTEYAAGESKSRADRYVMEAANNFDSIGMVDPKGNPTGPYVTAVNTAVAEANHAADLLMLPANSEQRQAMVRDVYGNVASGVVTNMMSAGRFLEAKSYIDKVVSEGKVDANTAMKLTSAIDSSYDRQKGIEIGESVYNGDTVGGKPADEAYVKAVTTIVPGANVKVTGRRIPVMTGTQPGRQPLQMDGVRPDLISNWELVQGDFGRAVPVVSGKRDAATNAAAGGAKQSQHLDGNAIDVDVSSMPKEERIRLIKMAAARGFTGIGVYENSLHFDMREGGPAMWGPSHHADSIPAWAKGMQLETRPGGTSQARNYHIPGSTSDGFQSIDVQPIKGMAINDFVKLMRSRGLEVTDILDQSQQQGVDQVWHMAVKIPNQMVGSREGGVTVPSNPDGEKDLGAMEAAVKNLGLDPDQEAVALQTVRSRYVEDRQVKDAQYKSLFDSASEVAFARVGGWQDIDPVTWGKLKQEDRAKLIEQPRGSDPDTVIKFLDDPSLGEKGKIEQYRHLLSESDYQKFYAIANGPDGKDKVREATIDMDMFKNTLVKNGFSTLVDPQGDDLKQQKIALIDQFKVRIDAEQIRQKKVLSRNEKQEILDSMLIDRAFTKAPWWTSDYSKPVAMMSVDEYGKAYVTVGGEDIWIGRNPDKSGASSISDQQIINMKQKLVMDQKPVTMQAIVEEWVKSGKPK